MLSFEVSLSCGDDVDVSIVNVCQEADSTD